MDTDKHGFKLPEGEPTHAIIGAALEVLNGLGHGLHEKPYENALVVEFGLRGLAIDQQRRYPVIYKSVQVSEYVPDLLVGAAVIVDAKVIERITDNERGQMINYLRSAKLRVGLIINFHKPKLEWERVVL
jgi:GxxExxY protein